MTVDYIYQFSLRLILKNQAGGLSSTDFAFHWNGAQASYQGDLLGRFQKAGNGKSGVNTGIIENEIIISKLTPFINNTSITVAAGQAAKPSGLVYTLAIRSNGYPVFSVSHNEIWSLQTDVIDPPSIVDNAYYYSEYLGYYKILPTATASIELDYIASPTDVVWAYIFDSDMRQVYNPTGSSQPQWDDNSCREITERMLKTLGVAFHDKDFEQFGQTVINSGE